MTPDEVTKTAAELKAAIEVDDQKGALAAGTSLLVGVALNLAMIARNTNPHPNG